MYFSNEETMNGLECVVDLDLTRSISFSSLDGTSHCAELLNHENQIE